MRLYLGGSDVLIITMVVFKRDTRRVRGREGDVMMEAEIEGMKSEDGRKGLHPSSCIPPEEGTQVAARS